MYSVEGIERVYRTVSDNRIENMVVTVVVQVKKNCNILENCRALQEKCVKIIEEMTAFHIKEMNIEIKEIA